MDTAEIIQTLESEGEIECVSEVRVFVGTRKEYQVKVELYDKGPNTKCPSSRFFCEAVRKDGKSACGNPHSDARGAILNVHWGELD